MCHYNHNAPQTDTSTTTPTSPATLATSQLRPTRHHPCPHRPCPFLGRIALAPALYPTRCVGVPPVFYGWTLLTGGDRLHPPTCWISAHPPGTHATCWSTIRRCRGNPSGSGQVPGTRKLPRAWKPTSHVYRTHVSQYTAHVLVYASTTPS